MLEAADVVADTISQGTYITDIGSTPWPTPTATSSPPLNFGVGFQPRAPRPILFQPYPRLSPGSTVIDRHSIEGFNTFGEVAYNPILNPDEQSQEERELPCNRYIPVLMTSKYGTVHWNMGLLAPTMKQQTNILLSSHQCRNQW